ncbi:MAG: PAS domain-containing sensor histidine kinase, partial [Candidatus Latescibacterota bacterium]
IAQPVNLEIKSANGKSFWGKMESRPLLDSTGQVTGVCMAVSDITGQKMAEDELRKARDDLEEQVRQRTAELEETIVMLKQEIAGRKVVQEVVQKNERCLNTVLDTLPVGVMVLDREGKIVRTNPASQRIWGKSEYGGANEYRTFKGWRTNTGEYIEADQWAVARSLRMGDFILDEEIEIEDFEGKYKIILDSAASLRDENGNIYGAIMVDEDITDRKMAELELRDYKEHLEELVDERTVELESANSRLKKEIEERKQIEKTLRESEEKFRIALKNAPINMVMQDRNRSHIWVYDAQSRLRTEDIYGKREEDLFPPEEAARLIEIKERVMATGIGERIEMPLTLTGMVTVFLDITIEPMRDTRGEVIGVVSVNLNITERKRVEEELRQSEMRFRAAVDNFPGVFLVYDSKRRIQFVNRIGIEKSGHAWEEIIGHCDEEVYPKSVIDTYMPSLLRAIETKEPQTLEAHLTPDKEYWVLMNIVPLLNTHGDIWQILIISYDITSRKRAEERANELNKRLRQQTAQFEAANKELESFSYSISHDLRAPLRTLDGFSSALLEDYADRLDAGGQNYLNRIRAAALHMSRLIDDLLNLSRPARAELHYTTVSLSAHAEFVVEELRHTEPHRTVEVVVQEGIMAEGDEILLHQVLQNLLGNAWKFTSHREAARIEFGEKREDGRRIFFVRDNGAGFDMKHAGDLFIPFRRLHTDSEFPGMGIGLSIVKRIIERHGGSIRAESEPGKGATFFFALGE